MDDQGDQVLNFDASQLTYREWCQLFFDQPIDKNIFWEERSRYDCFIEAAPAVVVKHLQSTCLEHKAILEEYSAAQVDQGLWAIFATYSYHSTLLDSTIDLELRIQCIESMYHVYSDVVAGLDFDEFRNTFYGMWWDYIGHEIWSEADDSYQVERLSVDQQRILDAVIRTLVRVLELPYRSCQWAALHGFGHAHHPRAPEIVQNYLDLHGSELSSDERAWVEACRDGTVV